MLLVSPPLYFVAFFYFPPRASRSLLFLSLSYIFIFFCVACGSPTLQIYAYVVLSPPLMPIISLFLLPSSRSLATLQLQGRAPAYVLLRRRPRLGSLFESRPLGLRGVESRPSCFGGLRLPWYLGLAAGVSFCGRASAGKSSSASSWACNNPAVSSGQKGEGCSARAHATSSSAPGV